MTAGNRRGAPLSRSAAQLSTLIFPADFQGRTGLQSW